RVVAVDSIWGLIEFRTASRSAGWPVGSDQVSEDTTGPDRRCRRPRRCMLQFGACGLRASRARRRFCFPPRLLRSTNRIVFEEEARSFLVRDPASIGPANKATIISIDLIVMNEGRSFAVPKIE